MVGEQKKKRAPQGEALTRRKTEVAAASRLLTKIQVADLMGVSWRTVNRWVASGKLKAVRAGRVLRFEPSELEKFKARSSTC
ncbi:helix-turn-helix domain-containing protein [Singulisphaera acidiphila]|uniref:DNA-binding protein, excisionase family n=1 Tax=Singulisphaera acidiphila (strain ATCC BAA-1392 / DSM 18658 / VKM B-2454 / MOB10) TaxID=886293 RepID=L0DRL3_SINAD|nr:helix-turn-helix domain-containing protein [Singulisphaera acidiphila]AGA31658.1 DNA-binding protein, excisionase family [Singulisphaera acidiphila DSM 18658]